jgi:hypothetical protein
MSWFSDPPAPPDPVRTAAAATATNVGTSVANAFLNNVNQVTPQGSLQYDVSGNYSWADPTTGQTYNIPRFTASQFLSPTQQQIQQQGDATKLNLGQLSQNQSGMLTGLLGTPFNPNQGNFQAQAYLQANPDVAAAARNSFSRDQNNFNAQAYLAANPDVAAAGVDPWTHYQQFGANEGRQFTPIAYQNPYDFAAQHWQNWGSDEGRAGAGVYAPGMGDINQLQNVPGALYGYADVGGQQRSLGNYGSQAFGFGDEADYNKAREHAENALYQRMDPQLQRDRAAMEARLADQGIKIGSPGYQAAMDQFNRQLTDTRLGITQAGAAEQQQAYQQALGRGQFYNQAQAQQFQEQLQAGTFANQAQQQDYQQAALRAQFANAAAAQNLARGSAIYGAQNQLRNQYISEQYAQRNQPINEITALLSGSQVTNPSFVNTPNQQIPTTDVAGLINNRFSQDMDVYKQQSANFNSLMGGIFGMMGGMVRSDRREKENIDRVGTVFAANEDGDKPLPVYQYSYKDDPTSTRHVGPMAQDVEKVDRSAVKTRKGVKYIDTTKLGSILKVA